MRDLDDLFAALERSAFRARFRLGEPDAKYLLRKGLDQVLSHGREFIGARLAPADPKNDGRQTPLGGHPFFVAQHATAICCRGCLAKWHGIAAGRQLESAEIEHVLRVARRWLSLQIAGREAHRPPTQRVLSGFGEPS